MENKKRNRLLKAAGIAVAALTALVMVANFYVESHARKIITDKFAKLTNGRYLLSVGDVKVNPLRRSVTLTDLTVIPDVHATVVEDTLSARNPYLLNFSAARLLAAGIRFRNGLEIKKVRLVSPRINVRKLRTDGAPSDPEKKINPLTIEIGQIIISDGNAEFHDGDTLRSVIEGLEFSTERLLVDTVGGISARSLGDNMMLFAARIRHMNGDGSICMEIDSLAAAMAAESIRIGSFALIPTYSKEQFGWRSWNHKDWVQARLSGISCHGVDFRRLVADGELHIDSIHLAEGNFASYKNRNIIRNEWAKPLYHQTIQRLPVRFAVRKTVIGSFDARYEELKLDGDKPGAVTFDGIGGEIGWLSNIPTPDRPYSEWRLRARLMDAAPLTVSVFMPTDSLNDRFEIAAILGKTDMKLLNAMTVPLANIEIKGGTVDKLDCLITGDSRQASVDMTFLYGGLDLVLLKKKKGQIKENTLASEIISTILLIDGNPRRNEIRRVQETTQRDPYRSPLNYLWRTVFAGVKETVGLGRF